MSIFLLYHLRRLVLLSLYIIRTHSLECYAWNMGDCLIGHHWRWRFQTSGVRSFPLDSHQMASASSQAVSMEEFVCGTPLRERQRQAHLLDTRIRSRLWHSHQMASASSQARKMEQFFLWHSRQMVSASSQARTMEQFVCGTPLRERHCGDDTKEYSTSTRRIVSRSKPNHQSNIRV